VGVDETNKNKQYASETDSGTKDSCHDVFWFHSGWGDFAPPICLRNQQSIVHRSSGAARLIWILFWKRNGSLFPQSLEYEALAFSLQFVSAPQATARMRKFLAEGVRQSGESANRHPHGEALSLQRLSLQFQSPAAY